MTAVVIAVILTALMFDFTNGFHDTANAMATSIATGALRPRVAVILAGVLNLVGAFLSVRVALTISGGSVDEARITPEVIFGGLVGAILWNPAATAVAYRLARHGDRHTVSRGFRSAQVVSASMVALAHGTNDAQKTMGVITLTLITVGQLPVHAAPPPWVIAMCGLAIAAGTATGGWRIIQTLGRRITQIESPQGFAAETASTAVILSAAHLGFALYTTQVTSGAVFGSVAGRRAGVVRWGVAGRMAVAWLLTLPAAAIVGALAAWVASGPAGTVLVGAVLVAVAGGIYAASRRSPVTAATVNDALALRPVAVAAPAAA